MRAWVVALGVLLTATSSSAWTAPSPLAGNWEVTTRFASGSGAGHMTLSIDGEKVTGASEPLDQAGYFPLDVEGVWRGGVADLRFSFRGKPVGEGALALKDGRLSGRATLYGTATAIEAERSAPASAAPRTHDFRPDSYQIGYGPDAPPVLRISPGDTVRTSTLDNQGRDKDLRWRGMPGNTLTGPFYVVGAMPGDTLVVHLLEVALNRDSADMYSARLNDKAVQASPPQTPTKGWGTGWKLDRAGGTARLEAPGERLAGVVLPLAPMIGSIGVAPPTSQTLSAGDLGFHGGNLDYPRMMRGATLYLPVFRRGALLSLGDGHARQGDGEITGQGLETSLDVAFKVELIKGQNLGQVWSEDAEAVMVSGIDNTLDTALQMATSGLARWLKSRYDLNDSEVAALLGAAVAYEIAEVVDPRPHVVARISKKTLSMLKRAEAAAAP